LDHRINGIASFLWKGWTNEFNPKLLAGAGEGLGLFWRGRTRRIRKPFVFGRSPEGADEGLELASRDGEHSSLIRFNSVGVGNALWGQERLPRTGPALLLSNAIANLTLKDVEDLVLVVMDVQGRGAPL
jgi:hypothetical protein